MRTLTLKKETLTELAAGDLSRIVGAGSVELRATLQARCIDEYLSLGCMSWHTEEC